MACATSPTNTGWIRVWPPPINLGPAAIRAHQLAGHVTAPDQYCSNVRKFLPWRRPHVTFAGEAGGARLAGKIFQ
jgi:hypothetical protein